MSDSRFSIRSSILQVLILGLLLGADRGGFLHAQQPDPNRAVIARAGEMFITEEEFIRRFEMLPGLYRHRRPQLEGAKLELLYSLIAEKLLAQEAQERGLAGDSLVQIAYVDLRGLLARDRLYRQEVSGKVTVTDVEVAHGISRALRQIAVTFFHFDRREDAEFIRGRISTRQELETMAFDTSVSVLRDTATVVWGEADPAIEEAAYALTPNEVSPVIATPEGYFILSLLRSLNNSFYSAMQPEVLRERVAETLRLRKERARLDEFVVEALKGKTGYARAEPFRRFIALLEEELSQEPARDKAYVGERVVTALSTRFPDLMDDTLAVMEHVSWSVGEVLERLYRAGFGIDVANMRKLAARLNAQLRQWVQQELLAREALARGLHEHPDVREELALWYNTFLADALKERVRSKVHVTDHEALAYLQDGESGVAVPRVTIRELHTTTLKDMDEAMTALKEGASFDRVIDRWSADSASKARRGLSDPFPIYDRHPLGEIAWQMEVGDRFGPVRFPTGYVYFELVEKTADARAADTSLAGRLEQGKRELLAMKRKRMLDLFIAQVGEKRGFDVFLERLRSVEVSTIPMMTFRVLGFGGRMFAVPFVDRQIDWLNVEPPAAPLLP